METTKISGKIFISIAIVVLSFIGFIASKNFSDQGAYVEVKGLSEKIVKSDTAIWSMNFEVKSNSIDALYGDIEKNLVTIKTFLKTKGFDDAEINVAPANIYQDTYKDAAFRYNSTNQISVYTNKVDIAKKSSSETLMLVKSGVVLTQNSIAFNFSDLNSVKPDMLAEAIKNARDTAAQFATNSGSKVGGIVRGNQGVFDIVDKDPGSPEFKKIRLVSTLRFLLK